MSAEGSGLPVGEGWGIEGLTRMDVPEAVVRAEGERIMKEWEQEEKEFAEEQAKLQEKREKEEAEREAYEASDECKQRRAKAEQLLEDHFQCLRREFLRNHGARFGLPVPPPEPGDEPAPKAGGPDLRIADGLVDAPASYDEIETPWGTTPAPYETWPVPLPGAKPPADAMDTSEPEDDGDADDLLRHFAGRTDAPMDAAPMDAAPTDAAPMDAAPTSPKRRAKKDRKKKSKKART